MISHKLVCLGLAICSGFFLVRPPDVGAASISLQPAADTSILSAFPTFNFGGGTTITAGGRPQGGVSRALLLFDVQASLPAGAIVQSVSLSLTVLDTPSGAVNSVFDLNTLSSPWGEGTGSDHDGSPAGPNEATWNNPYGTSGSPWRTPGGDYSSSLSAFVSVLGNGTYTFGTTPALVSDVQGWLSHPASDFGWILRSESEQIGRTIRRFGSHGDVANSPVLNIQYAVPEPGPVSLLLVGAAGVAWKQRRRATNNAV